MPRQKIRNVESLSEKARYTLARQFAEQSYPRIQELVQTTPANHVEDGESVSTLQFINEFDEWPSHLLVEIIDALRKRRWLSVKHFQLLLTKQTQKLDLSSILEFKRNYITKIALLFLPLAAVTCPKLTVLLMGCEHDEIRSEDDSENEWSHSLKCYQLHLPQFKHLQVLDVSYNFGTFDDSCMKILGTHCRDLRELNVVCCHVTDVGMEELCGGANNIGNEMLEGQGGQCKSLEKLTIYDTSITEIGVKIALRNLHHLKVVKSEYLTDALVNLHQNDLAPPTYALVELPCFGRTPLRLFCKLCPFLVELCLFDLRDVTDSDLLSLVALKGLRELQLSSFREENLIATFDGGFVPVLKEIGPSLEVLELNSMRLCLDNVLEYCTNLKRLSLICCIYSTLAGRYAGQASRRSKRTKIELLCANLKELVLCASPPTEHNEPIPPEILLLALTSSPALEELEIYDCDTLDDDVLQRAFQIHSFNSLTKLSLNYCNFVTKTGVDLFIQNGNALKSLSIKWCGSLMSEDIETWREDGKKNNWDFCVSVY